MRILSVTCALLIAASTAHADCVDPVGESATQTGSSVTLHKYPEEAIVCIADPTEYCEDCEAGFEHICRHNRWAPLRTRACDTSVEPLSLAMTTGYTRAGASSDDSSPRTGRTDARRLYDALRSCEFRSYEDETFEEFMEEVVEEGLQNASMSELTVYLRKEYEVDIPRRIRQEQADRNSSPPTEREYYDETIAWLEDERREIGCVLELTGS